MKTKQHDFLNIPRKNVSTLWKGVLFAFLIIVIISGGILYSHKDDLPNTKPSELDGRLIDYVDNNKLNSYIKETRKLREEGELAKGPYKNTIIPDGSIQYHNKVGDPNKTELKEIYADGVLDLFMADIVSRNPEDEEINPNQKQDFNEFVSAVNAMDDMEIKKLNDEEVEQLAVYAETLASLDKNPVHFYIGDVIRSLKEKEPTTASIYYLMYANRIPLQKIVEDENYFISDYSDLLDTSYVSKQEKSIIEYYSFAMERPNHDFDLGIAHYRVDGLLTTYGAAEMFRSNLSYNGNNTCQEGESTIIGTFHYKDISNMLLSEYGIYKGNMNATTLGMNTASYSQYKPSFTWGISPEIEDICSTYYDIVEPQVYRGTFKKRQEAYEETAKTKSISIDKVRSAVMTYEYWALS